MKDHRRKEDCMGSVLIFVSEFAVFALILGLYLLRRHTLRKEASSVDLFRETTFERKTSRSKWLRHGNKSFPFLKA
jgi:hypothetical protein